MKKTGILLLLAFTTLNILVAQDIITLKTGEELNAHVLKLNPEDVIYVAENSSDTISISRGEITKLLYKNGIIVLFSEDIKPALLDDPGNDSLYILGEADAKKYYKGYKAATAGTIITSLFFPFGLIPAVAFSATPPAYSNLGFKDTKLIENSSYYEGYTKKAHNIKKKKVWGGFAVGSGISVGFTIMMSLLILSFY